MALHSRSVAARLKGYTQLTTRRRPPAARRYQSAREVKSGLAGAPDRPPSPISRYRKELSQKSERTRSTSNPERREFPKVAWGSWATILMVLAAAFMTWVSLPTHVRGNVLIDAWHGTFAGLPMWLQLFVGLAIAVIRNLRVRRYEVPRAVTLVLSGFGTLYCCGLVMGSAIAPEASAKAGSVITMLCMGGWLIVELMEYLEARRPPVPQQPRQRVRRRRGRRTSARRS